MIARPPRARALLRRNKGLTLAAFLLIPLISISLKAVGFVRTMAWIERTSKRRATKLAGTREHNEARELEQIAAIAGSRGVVAATCLRQSLFVHWILRRRGFDSRLKLGVRRSGNAFDAHAWVELEGLALGDSSGAHVEFRELNDRIPSLCPRLNSVAEGLPDESTEAGNETCRNQADRALGIPVPKSQVRSRGE